MKFLSIGKELGVNGLMEEIVNNETNNTMEDDVTEGPSFEKLETSLEQRNGTPGNIVNENGNILITDGLQLRNIGFACNKCDAEYVHKRNLYAHIRSAHEGVKFDCSQCDYQATQKGNLTCHIQSVHE